MWVPEFREAALTQEIDVIGEPIRTDFGYHIVRVEERGVTEDEQVISQLTAQKYEEYLHFSLDDEIEQIDLSS
jgi:foldase protein PrsA